MGGNSFAQNAALARAYEDKHDVSLAAALSDKCGKKLSLALRALLLPKAKRLACNHMSCSLYPCVMQPVTMCHAACTHVSCSL